MSHYNEYSHTIVSEMASESVASDQDGVQLLQVSVDSVKDNEDEHEHQTEKNIGKLFVLEVTSKKVCYI